MEHGKSCKCPCHKVMGILVSFIGVLFLLRHFAVIDQDTLAVMWPILLILVGLNKAYGKGMCKCCSEASQ